MQIGISTASLFKRYQTVDGLKRLKECGVQNVEVFFESFCEYNKKFGKKLKIVYTPVHGSGFVPVTTILKKIGIKPILVEEQIRKDTEFSTVEIPNPEHKETLTLGIKLADFKNADVESILLK